MNTKILELFSKYKLGIIKVIDAIFTISMGVFIAISHGEQDLVGTHMFNFFASCFSAFGVLLYILKKPSTKELIVDVFFKVITLTSISILLAMTINKLDFSGLYSVFYLIYIILLYSLLEKKSRWLINGEYKKLSPTEFLEYRFNTTISWIPNLLIIGAIILPGIFNFSTAGYVISLIIGYILGIVVVYIAERKIPSNPNNTFQS